MLPVIDDASRMMLSLVESKNATTDASLQAIEEISSKIQQKNENVLDASIHAIEEALKYM